MIIVRLVLHNDLLSKGIIFRTNGEYAHAEAITPQGTIIGSYAEGGVQERPLDYDKGNYEKELLLLLNATSEQSDKFYHYLRAPEVLGEKYGFIDILGFASGLHIHIPHEVICSALITLSLRGCDWLPRSLPMAAHTVSPALLHQMLFARAIDDFKIITRDELKCFII